MRRRDDREYSRCLTFLTWSNEGRARKLLTSLSILYLCGKGTRVAHRFSVKIILALLRAVLRVWKRARANVARHSSASIMLMIFGLDEGLTGIQKKSDYQAQLGRCRGPYRMAGRSARSALSHPTQACYYTLCSEPVKCVHVSGATTMQRRKTYTKRTLQGNGAPCSSLTGCREHSIERHLPLALPLDPSLSVQFVARRCGRVRCDPLSHHCA